MASVLAAQPMGLSRSVSWSPAQTRACVCVWKWKAACSKLCCWCCSHLHHYGGDNEVPGGMTEPAVSPCATTHKSSHSCHKLWSNEVQYGIPFVHVLYLNYGLHKLLAVQHSWCWISCYGWPIMAISDPAYYVKILPDTNIGLDLIGPIVVMSEYSLNI